eukprot:TRINITY_DN12471_c0_g1_i3.p1 TRINITY_DN12471_c0_g1~~TRINITY_DN12471_c0_g1_i3.p1  ORF type:complete len:255 (-),score=44.80 TRINITY_DN12471_c0_g1_i3:28-792(-)
MKRSSVPRQKSINGLASKHPGKPITSQGPAKESVRDSSGRLKATRSSKENVNVNIRAVQKPFCKPTKASQLRSNGNVKKQFLLRDKKSLNSSRIISNKNSQSFHSSPSKELKSNPLSKNEPACTTITDIEQQTLNIFQEYGEEIEQYQRSSEGNYATEECLKIHDITPALRAKMVDWMIEVLTSFKCSDRTFFLAIKTMDRHLKAATEKKPVSELHLIGVTAMFLASKYEDVYPLRMSTVHEKVAHKKLSIKTR